METKVTVSAEAPVLEGARTQIASTISQNEVQRPAAERPQLLRPRAVRARRLSHQYRRQSAFRGNVGRARTGNFHRQPAELLQQLHHRWRERQRRRGGRGRHLYRPRRGAGVSGGHLRRPGGVGTGAGRLRQRGDEERRQRDARRTSTDISATAASMRPTHSPIPFCR